jgi:hypothetical protein
VIRKRKKPTLMNCMRRWAVSLWAMPKETLAVHRPWARW